MNIKHGMTKEEGMLQGSCPRENFIGPPTRIEAMTEVFKKADPDGTKVLALLKGYGNVGSICPLCAGKIKRVVCHKHDEEFEIGHAENCPNRNAAVRIGDDCVIEQVD